MDRPSVSLWCEEMEDHQSQEQRKSEERVQGLNRTTSQLRAAWDPTVSGGRVIQRLLQVEERYLPSLLYISLVQREPDHREELTRWALEVKTPTPAPRLPFPPSSC